MKPGTLLLFTIFLFSFAKAQTTRTVKGKVYDSAHVVLQGATVLLFKKNGGDTLKTVTDRSGQYIFSKVPSPAFRIRVTNVGMEDAEQDYDFE
ncbi:MAG: carboxypeptidase regulatory-like domain-containing protein, partial [Chitinophagaceae bacterium]|nr:carboxypeptidase regulatory-like domain-containing protein [Chitinophagaceae bacterium]